MSLPVGDIPLIDDTNLPSPAASSREKSVELKKRNITQKEKEKERGSIQSTRSKTSKISGPSSDKKSVDKPTSRTITKHNQTSIQPSVSKSPGKSLPEKSKLKDRPGSSQTSLENGSRAGNVQRPTSGSGGARTTSRTTTGRSKPRGETERDTVKLKSNTVVANKSKAINRGSSSTTTTSVVNKTTTKQVSNNKVDSKSKIKEPPHHQQNTNNVVGKKCLVEKSLKEIATDVGGRNIELTGGGSHPVREQRHNYIYTFCSPLLIFFLQM